VTDVVWFPIGADEVALLRDGKRAFPEMLGAIERAEHEVLLEMYWISPDTCGLRFLDALTAAARRGVRVRVVYDAIGSLGITPAFFTKLIRSGGQAYEFHALFPIRNAITTGAFERRDHRKLLVVDGLVGFTGGINLSRQWLPVEDGGEGWRDDMIAARGPIVQELRTLFYDTWRRTSGALPPADVKALPRKRGARTWVLANTPTRAFGPVRQSMRSKRRSVRREYLVRIERARHNIDIANSYFVPNRSVRGALFRAAARGVRVRVLVPERGDVPIVQFAVEALFERLVTGGIEIYTLPSRVLHAKTAIIDDSFATIGSYNLDERSWTKNMELNLAVEDAAFAKHVRGWFEHDCASAHRVEIDAWRTRSYPRRAMEWFAYGLRRLW
jgi:cardiolipin synthase